MRRQELSRDRRRLLDLMRDMSYGRIENLTIRAGEPVFDESLRLIREVLLGRKANGRASPPQGDFKLKAQQIEVFDCFDRLQNGFIPVLKVQDGLPFQLQLEERVTT
ncbi:MAG: hypothetical protein P9X24_09990 [Candidatus Hatepunaea meridiana]|nr:hypothetical protein [Candidatus Hatepunaea meridiana]